MKFTERSIIALKPKQSRYEVWENNGKGFGLRISPSGRKSWLFMYRFDGKARRMTLGTFPRMKLASAHKAHADAKEQLDLGIDPGTKLVESRQAERKASTIQNLADEYIEKWAKPRKRSWKEDERILNKDVIPAWGRKKAKDIHKRDVITLLDKVVDRGAPVQANRTLATIRKMFNFAVSRDIVEISPCISVQAPAKENQRDRVLSRAEIKKFWNNLDDTDMTEGIRLALRLQLILAQRKGEIVGAEKSEFDLKNGWWTIPAEKAKNGLPHRVPLPEIAIDLLNQAFDLAKTRKELIGGNTDKSELLEDSRWVFPSPRGSKPITGTAVDHAVRRNAGKFEIDSFTPHDLRRTAASQMTAIGISRLVVSKILNHAENGITAVYDRHSYDNEKKHALSTWAYEFESIINESKKDNIIELKR